MFIMKKIVYKTLFIALLLVSFNYIYTYTFYESDLQTHSGIINLVRKITAEKSEVVYVGESSNITFRSDDVDKRSIGEFVSDYFPSLRFGSITKVATHAGIYYELLRNIPDSSDVKTIIVTLNLRSFDVSWIYSNLETPLQKSIVLLKDYPPLYKRFLLSFRGYDIKTDEERELQFKKKWKNDILIFPEPFRYDNVIDWDYGMATQGIRNQDSSVNYPATELACHYIKTFAFQIDTLTNPRIKDFDNIVSLASERKWNLVFNLMAENLDRADSLVGKELIFLIKQNRDLLIERYRKNNVIVVDNLDSVNDSEYIDRNWTTEHYAELGRKIIAKNVAESMKVIYPNEFTEIVLQRKKPKDFFNDCEGNIIWGQMQSLTDNRAYSGVMSSGIGANNEYSISFDYPIKNLPDSLHTLNIDMQLYQTNIDHDANLTVEISGGGGIYHLNSILINKLSAKIEDWNRCSYSFELPNDFYNADLIKVYVYNPTNTQINIDDISINFQ